MTARRARWPIALLLEAAALAIGARVAQAQAYVTTAPAEAAPGASAAAAVTVQLPAGQQLATLQFNITVLPTGAAPAIEPSISFVSSEPPSHSGPSLLMNEGAATVLVGWLQEISPPLAGDVVIGTLTVPIPATAHAGDEYRIEIRRPSGTTAGLAKGSAAVALTARNGRIRVSAPVSPCVGDCTNDRTVDVSDVVRGVNIALGSAALHDCPAFDQGRDQSVTVDELIMGVANALNGCSLGP